MKSDEVEPQKWAEEVYGPGIALRFPLKGVLFSGQSPYQKVEVLDTTTHGRVLLNDGCFMVSERDEFIYHEMIAHVPLYAHPNPRRVLIIGGGDGGTAREVLAHKSVESCVMVEIDAMVIESCREYLHQMSDSLKDPRLHLLIEDGVKYLEQCQETFDVVIIDSTDPVGPAQPLFGREFYANVARVLTPQGVVVAQGESPFYNTEMQVQLLKTMGEFFKNVRPYNFTNMTYPGGYWSFMFASRETSFWPANLNDKIGAMALKFKYYNAEVHQAAFVLPNFMRKALGSYLKG